MAIETTITVNGSTGSIESIDSKGEQPSSYIGNASNADQMDALKRMSEMAGIRLPETRLPEGTSLLQVGEDNKRALQCEVAALPSVKEGLASFVAKVQAEDAKDVLVPIQRVRMSPVNGGLYGEGQDPSKALAYTRDAFSQVVQVIKPAGAVSGVGAHLLTLPNDLRSQVFNFHAQNVVGKGENAGNPAAIRTFKAHGRRIVRAITSEKHSLTTGDDLSIAEVIGSLPDGGKLRVTRSVGGGRTDFEIIWPAMDRQLVVGDIALMCLRVSNSETKKGALKVSPSLLRVLCYNFTTAYSEGGESEFTFRHVGDLRVKLARAIREASTILEPFVRAFGDAYKVALPEFAPTRGEVLERVQKAFALSAGVLDVAGQSWDMDGDKSAGDTLAGLAHALTRASQGLNMAEAAEVEKVAGKLVSVGWGALN